jgi:hydroxymethylglutaryl-CoA reductase
VIATGNDFRAVEASVHAYAARDGSYRSLSYTILSEDKFRFGLRIPMTVGSVGGITRIHPLSDWSHKILGNPDAGLLMQIIASAGLANNFSAIRSLITRGIQHGHMKLQLTNILNILHASKEESEIVNEHFKNIKVSYSSVNEYLNELRRT